MKEPKTTQWLTRSDGLATKLREARGDMPGLTLAKTLGWASSKVTRIERGTQMPTEDDVRKWAAATHLADPDIDHLIGLLHEVHAMRGVFRQRAKNGQGSIQAEYTDLVASSSLVRYFQMSTIPSVVQLPDYARHVLAENATLYGGNEDPGDIESAVAARMARQRLLYEPTRRFEILIAEPVLRWGFVAPDVMRAQLDRLLSLDGMSNVRFGILPLDKPLTLTPQNSFSIYDELVVTETYGIESKYQGDDPELHSRVLNLLWRSAVNGDDARELIMAAIGRLPR